jgi:hypothetical protein
MSKSMTKNQNNRTTSADVSVADPNATLTLSGELGCESEHIESHPPMNACEDEIRLLAHRKWEAAGCPAGDGIDFWLNAEREVNSKQCESSAVQE